MIVRIVELYGGRSIQTTATRLILTSPVDTHFCTAEGTWESIAHFPDVGYWHIFSRPINFFIEKGHFVQERINPPLPRYPINSKIRLLYPTVEYELSPHATYMIAATTDGAI